MIGILSKTSKGWGEEELNNLTNRSNWRSAMSVGSGCCWRLYVSVHETNEENIYVVPRKQNGEVTSQGSVVCRAPYT